MGINMPCGNYSGLYLQKTRGTHVNIDSTRVVIYGHAWPCMVTRDHVCSFVVTGLLSSNSCYIEEATLMGLAEVTRFFDGIDTCARFLNSSLLRIHKYIPPASGAE
jgi:hypothetical protein